MQTKTFFSTGILHLRALSIPTACSCVNAELRQVVPATAPEVKEVVVNSFLRGYEDRREPRLAGLLRLTPAGMLVALLLALGCPSVASANLQTFLATAD